jgi:UDPglucose--hexose-1-phosphate uridylyltransferase
VPNKFPALRRDHALTLARDGIFEKMPATGSHEVVIETPEHGRSLAQLDPAQVDRVLRAYQERFLALEAERHHYIFIFRNHGIVAGASLEHGHSQIIASPVIPPHALQKIEGVARYAEYSGRCVYGDIVEHETRIGERIVIQNESFLCFAPFASRRPFELWIVPLKHDAHFARIDANRRRDLAAILRETLLRLDLALGDPPYNLALLTTSTDNDFHWHIEILPRLAVAGGFELGAGIYINTVAPEPAAAFLRRATVPERCAASNGSHAHFLRALVAAG